jgi:hypothetical protein
MSQFDTTTIAERINSTIYLEFCVVTFQSWVKYWLGYSDLFVSRFLGIASNSRQRTSGNQSRRQAMTLFKSNKSLTSLAGTEKSTPYNAMDV